MTWVFSISSTNNAGMKDFEIFKKIHTTDRWTDWETKWRNGYSSVAGSQKQLDKMLKGNKQYSLNDTLKGKLKWITQNSYCQAQTQSKVGYADIKIKIISKHHPAT